MRKGEEWEGACPIEEHEAPIAVIGERFQCYGCGACGDALAFLRAVGEPDPEGALSNGRGWDATLLKPTPPPPRYGLHRILLPDNITKTVLITDSRAQAKAADGILTAYVVVAWPDGGRKWDALEPLKGRKVLLWPSPTGMEPMQRLERILADPRGLGCTGKILTEGRELTGTLDTKELIAWAREHTRPLQNPAQVADAAPVAVESVSKVQAESVSGESPSPGPFLPIAAPPASGPSASDLSEPEAPPIAEFPPEARSERPSKRQRHLRSVDSGGNAARAPDPDAAALPEELSEDAMADAFAAQHGDDWRCVKAWNQWMHWDGEAWLEDRTDCRVEPMRELLRQALYSTEGQRLTPDGRRKLGKQAVAYAALRYAGTDARIRSTPEVWDADPYMLGVPGGVVDLRAGKLI